MSTYAYIILIFVCSYYLWLNISPVEIPPSLPYLSLSPYFPEVDGSRSVESKIRAKVVTVTHWRRPTN